MCLYEEAHGVDASHPIFRGPFPVTPTLHDMPTPEHYRRHASGVDLGPTMPAWRVIKEDGGQYHGVVADGHGFQDSPDCEWISSGKNTKNALAAALARQGNFFQWGFSGSPSQLTDEAQKVLLNTLAYMRGFDGARPLDVGEGESRQWLQAYAGYLDGGSSTFAASMLPPTWLQGGADAAKVQKLLQQELGFVRSDGRKWVVDDDCKALGVANNDAGFLPRCVELLGDTVAAPRALRLLQRYTDQHFDTAEGWQGWLQATAGRRFFSDRGGCRWVVVPEGYPAPYRAGR